MIPILTEPIYNILHTFSKSRSLPVSLVKRSQIILLAAQGMCNRKIAENVNLHYINVATWRNRFLQKQAVLTEIEYSAPDKLSDEIITILTDVKRPGPPRKFTSEQIIKIINLACKDPQEFGYEVSQWSLPLLVKESINQGITDQISAKSISRFLK